MSAAYCSIILILAPKTLTVDPPIFTNIDRRRTPRVQVPAPGKEAHYVWVRRVAQLARWACAFRRFRAWRSFSDSPPQTPVSWRDSMAQVKQVTMTSQRRQTTFAFSVCRSAG
jgi:hypothetical protein